GGSGGGNGEDHADREGDGGSAGRGSAGGVGAVRGSGVEPGDGDGGIEGGWGSLQGHADDRDAGMGALVPGVVPGGRQVWAEQVEYRGAVRSRGGDAEWSELCAGSRGGGVWGGGWGGGGRPARP